MSISLSLQAASPAFDGPVRVLRDAILFKPGERKSHLYLIEAGTVALYRNRIGRLQDVVEFAFAGDVVGFGFLEKHIYWAQAVGETRVKCLPPEALDHILRNERALQRYNETLRREFEFRRGELISAYRKPVSKLAAFFLALSQLNKHEGRDPLIITDSLECGIVASCLALDLESFGEALIQLEKAGMIQRCPQQGLRLTNLAGLTQLASVASNPLVAMPSH